MDIIDSPTLPLVGRSAGGDQPFTLRRLTVPASLDAADAADFITMTVVRNDVFEEISGDRDEALTPAELLPHFQPSPDNSRHSWVIVVEDAIVGRALLDLPTEQDSTVSYATLEMLEGVGARGIGSAVLPLMEQVARDAGRRAMQAWAEHPAASGPALMPPTGFGSIPRDHAARFALRHGFTLEQVERKSELDLASSDDRIRDLLAVAERASAGYRVAQWMLPTPPELRDGYAWVKSRMSTDAPAAGLDIDEEVWDAARIERTEARYADAGQSVLVTAAVETRSGALVAFNELMIGADRTGPTWQEDTLVLREHRGHKLGLLVKCAGILRWREFAPTSPKVITYNAEENRPMLDINESMGFVPVSYSGAWKKVLA